MTTYLHSLAILFAFVCGNALAEHYHTGQWFFRYAVPFFGVATILCEVFA